MLEAPKPPSAPKPEKTRTHSNLDPHKPLPAIPASPVEDQKQKLQKEKTQEEMPQSEKEGQGQKVDIQDGDAFFMTQVSFTRKSVSHILSMPLIAAYEKVDCGKNLISYHNISKM